MHKIAIKDCDVVFLSFDEPNADRNYADDYIGSNEG